jgi:hypothetical protein
VCIIVEITQVVKDTVVNNKDTDYGFEVYLVLLVKVICPVVKGQEDKYIDNTK